MERTQGFACNLLRLRVLFLFFFTLLSLTTHAQTQLLNDTGITKCGDYAFDGGSGTHNNDVDCSRTTDDQGDPVPPGQDGHYGRDVTHNDDSDGHAGFSFTKIASNGDALPASATSWSCVLDNVTGLMWEVKTDDGGLRDKDWNYTWYNSDAATNGGNAGTQNGGACYDSTNCDTEKFVAQVNTVGLCGHIDWRMPGREALRSIVDNSVSSPGPTIDSAWFPNTLAYPHWSASPYVYTSKIAWFLYFNDGYDGTANAYYAWQVRLVRGGESVSGSPVNGVGGQTCKTNILATTPTSRFTIHANGTVTDSRTGLMWKQCVEGLSGAGCTTGAASTTNWKSALDQAASHSFAGHEDWRVPNLKELTSIAELSCYNPAINLAVFPNTTSDGVWSASPYALISNYAWGLYFRRADDSVGDKDDAKQVRLVRGDSGLTPTVGDLSVTIDSDREIYRPGKANEFTVRIWNWGSISVENVELTISHDNGFMPTILRYWRCHESAGSCSLVSENIDDTGTREVFRLSLPGHSTTIIKGEGVFAWEKDSVKVSATISGGLPVDPNPANDSFSREIGTVPSALPGTQEAVLCNGPGSCDDSSSLNIDQGKPTVVLTHGLQDKNCTREVQWTSFREITPAAGHLLDDFFTAGKPNVLQYFWKGACHGRGAKSAKAYIQSTQNAPHAGELLAKKLQEVLGIDYNQKIHFIGHSMGTIVNAHAARKFLEEVTNVTDAQVTILDYPNRVSKIPGMTDDDERLYGFDRDFFASTLPFNRSGLDLDVDNYYAKKQTKSDTKLAGAGVGTSISAPKDILQRELNAPHEVGDALLPGEGAHIWGINTRIDNDHTGVNQWYRWTMRPRKKDNFEGDDVCPGGVWKGEPFILARPTLDPCQQGWHNSIIHAAFQTNSLVVPNSTSLSDLQLHVGSGNNCSASTFNHFICSESLLQAPTALPFEATTTATTTPPPTVSYLDATMTVPVNARYITFDYRFTNIGDGDYVYLMVDDRPIWKMSGDAVTENEWNESGPITIAMESGENTFVVALYGVGAQNAQFEAKKFQFIEVLPTFKDVPPAHTAYESVETLVDDSVVESCNIDNDLFCPDQALTRDTLAQWLMKALKGDSYTPDPATGTLFSDVKATDPFADWIEAFANEGITEGCDATRYCPNAPVDKAQLAKLLLITTSGTSFAPDPATGTLFDDVGTASFNADWIEDAAKEGLLEGCGYKQFCAREIMGRSSVARIVENVF